MLTDLRHPSGSISRLGRCAYAERGAANAVLVLALVVVLALGGAAWYFLPSSTDGTTGPEDGADQSQTSHEGPSRKTAEKQPEDGEGQAGKQAGAGSEEGSAKGKDPAHRPLTAAEQRVMGWEDKLHDPAASTKDKLEALRELRKLDKTGEQYVPMMNDMLRDARDEELARGVILEMRKRKNHAFGQPLLDSVMRREDKQTRIEAIRTLGSYLEEPAIKGVLSELAEKAGPEISHEVREALEGRKSHWNQGQGR